jgi:hypothetical protein
VSFSAQVSNKKAGYLLFSSVSGLRKRIVTRANTFSLEKGMVGVSIGEEERGVRTRRRWWSRCASFLASSVSLWMTGPGIASVELIDVARNSI